MLTVYVEEFQIRNGQATTPVASSASCFSGRTDGRTVEEVVFQLRFFLSNQVNHTRLLCSDVFTGWLAVVVRRTNQSGTDGRRVFCCAHNFGLLAGAEFRNVPPNVTTPGAPLWVWVLNFFFVVRTRTRTQTHGTHTLLNDTAHYQQEQTGMLLGINFLCWQS